MISTMEPINLQPTHNIYRYNEEWTSFCSHWDPSVHMNVGKQNMCCFYHFQKVAFGVLLLTAAILMRVIVV